MPSLELPEPRMITSALGRLAAGDNLSLDEMADVIDQVMQGSVPEGEIALLLTQQMTRSAAGSVAVTVLVSSARTKSAEASA
jgi:anthranilate phosphoribosyltransferase